MPDELSEQERAAAVEAWHEVAALAEWFGDEDRVPNYCEDCGSPMVVGVVGDGETLAACGRCIDETRRQGGVVGVDLRRKRDSGIETAESERHRCSKNDALTFHFFRPGARLGDRCQCGERLFADPPVSQEQPEARDLRHSSTELCELIEEWQRRGSKVTDFPASAVRLVLDSNGLEAMEIGTRAALEAVSERCPDGCDRGYHDTDDGGPGGGPIVPCERCGGHGRVPKTLQQEITDEMVRTATDWLRGFVGDMNAVEEADGRSILRAALEQKEGEE